MNLIIDHLTLYRNQKLILDDISFSANENDVVGIIGNNGAGKSSLLAAVHGDIEKHSGFVSRAYIEMVKQDILLENGDKTIQEWLTDLAPWQVVYIIDGAKVDTGGDNKISNLSGGERTRLAITYAMRPWFKPDVILLDEPTNNLDYAGIEWLTGAIKSFEGIVLLVSHDRALLNDACTKMVLLENTQLVEYTGNYDEYIARRSKEDSKLLAQHELARKQKRLLAVQIRLQRDNIRRGSSKHQTDNDKQARFYFENRTGRRSGKALQSLESKLGRVEDTEGPRKHVQYRTSLSGKSVARKLILSFDSVGFAYDIINIIENISFEMRSGEKLYIKGRNGSGKSTLLKLAAEFIQPTSGSVTYGKNIKIGYYAQDRDRLNDNASLYDQFIMSTKEDKTIFFENARALGLFPTDVKLKISALSRGQRSKAAILELLMAEYDLLILDEPTNHLDISTRELFEEALSRYAGAVIFSSHDAAFVNYVIDQQTKIIELKKS